MYCYGMKSLFLIPILALSMQAQAKTCSIKPAVIAVIDTGFRFSPLTKDVKLCKFGHKNFSSDAETYTPPGFTTPVPTDSHGHGTNIAGLIQKYAGNKNYCMVIIRYWSPKSNFTDDNLANTVKSIKYATSIGANYINYSGGGTFTSKEERKAVKEFLDKGGKFIAAAGNERSDIDTEHYYPAMDDPRVIAVGNAILMTEELEKEKLKNEEKDKRIVYVENKVAYAAVSSNYGYRVNRWEYGTNQIGFGISMTGTSQATAIATGKIINQTECEK